MVKLWSNDSGSDNFDNKTEGDNWNGTDYRTYDDMLQDLLFVSFSGFGLTPVSIVRIFLNILSVIVFLQPKMRRISINILLLGIQLSDLMLLCALLWTPGVETIFGWLGEKELRCFFSFSRYVLALQILGAFGSRYFTIAASVERYIAVCHPLKVRVLCSPRRAIYASIFVAILSLLFSITYWFNADVEDWTNKALKGLCLVTIIFTLQIVSFVSLLILNTAIYIGHRKSQRAVKSVGSTSLKEDNSLTLLLMSIVLTYLICNSFFVVHTILSIFSPHGYRSSDVRYAIFLPMTFLLGVNSASNFIFYCAFGAKFRSELRRALGCGNVVQALKG